MKYKGLLLDLDNTLYDYNAAHMHALYSVTNYFTQLHKIDEIEFYDLYNISRSEIHNDLINTASSHSRILYFQKLNEKLNLNPLKFSVDLEKIYWNSFMEKMILFEGVDEMMNTYKNRICIITDLTTQIQHKKILKLNLEMFIDKIVTSEEVGVEKPNAKIFNKSLDKLNLSQNNVCMIGDNFKKDIEGAVKLGIRSVWLNHENKEFSHSSNLIDEVSSFKEILNFI